MSVHQIVRSGGYGRHDRSVVSRLPMRRQSRSRIDWRTVALVAACAVILVALLARP